ncbi:MAG: ribonuclease HI [Rhodospirillaceae bacterium]|nr:ribonuclease HI [Rhodospirillaceae bacterium]|tara:strand:- start:2954 stop:3412 length:459 start_codon:yes stop_codon:yes gene_type:complete
MKEALKPFTGDTVVIYTDGACRGNPGPGGWGVVLDYKGHKKTLYGNEKDTTNNRMELTAAIKALEALKKPSKVEVFTDSKYVQDGITVWISKWKQNNWRTSARKPVKNLDLWKRLESALALHDVNWHWVKGHSGNLGNEEADMIAQKAIDSQ